MDMRRRLTGRVAGLAALTAAGLAVVVYAGVVLAGEGGGTGLDERRAGAANPVEEPSDTPLDLAGIDPVTGDEVSLADFAGKPVVLNVWASWCPGCNDEAADLREFAAAHPEVAVVGIDFQDSRAGARAFYDRWQWEHPSIFDVSGAMTGSIGLLGLPTTVFLDERHRIRARVVGATDRVGFERGLELATAS
jgi:thiol-disulfide isomerase/thioredoxin